MKLNFGLSFQQDHAKPNPIHTLSSSVCVPFFCFIGLLSNVKHTIWNVKSWILWILSWSVFPLAAYPSGSVWLTNFVVWILVSHHQSALAQASHQIFGSMYACAVTISHECGVLLEPFKGNIKDGDLLSSVKFMLRRNYRDFKAIKSLMTMFTFFNTHLICWSFSASFIGVETCYCYSLC